MTLGSAPSAVHIQHTKKWFLSALFIATKVGRPAHSRHKIEEENSMRHNATQNSNDFGAFVERAHSQKIGIVRKNEMEKSKIYA